MAMLPLVALLNHRANFATLCLSKLSDSSKTTEKGEYAQVLFQHYQSRQDQITVRYLFSWRITQIQSMSLNSKAMAITKNSFKSSSTESLASIANHQP